MKPGVTVVIPTINRESLAASLDSVIGQSFRNVELIIVDDSKEQSVKHREFRVLKTGGLKGVSEARNLGMLHADTEFTALLDDDDLWHREYLEKQISNMEHLGIDFGISGAIVNGHIRPKKQLKVGKDPFELLYGAPHLMRSKAYLPTSGYFFRTKIVESIKFDESITDRENLKFVRDCFICKFKIHQDTRPLVTINYSSKDSLGRINLTEELEWWEFLKNLNENWADNFLIESTRNLLRKGDRVSAKHLVKLINSQKNSTYKTILKIATI